MYAGLRAESQRCEIFGDRVDAHVVGEHIVIGIARDDDRFHHVDHAVAAHLVVAKPVAAEHEVAGVVDGLRRRALAGGERGQGHEGLERGARRIGAAQRPVEQRLVGRIVEQVPVRGIDAVDKQVGIEGRAAGEGQQLAAGRVDGHHRALAIAQRFLGDLLQFDVDGQGEAVAGHRRQARQGAHRAAASIDLHLLEAGRAVQVALVALLDADLADMLRALVVRGDVGVLKPLLVFLADAPDIADHMRPDLAHRILAKQPGLDFNPLEAPAVGREARHLLVAEPGANRQRVEGLRFAQQFLEALAVLRLHLDEFGQFVDGVVEVADLRRGDLQRIGRIVACQHHAIAIDDQSAVGHDRQDRYAIVLGQRLVFVVARDLQVDEARQQHREADQHHARGETQAHVKGMDLGFRVFQFRAATRQVVRLHGLKQTAMAFAEKQEGDSLRVAVWKVLDFNPSTTGSI